MYEMELPFKSRMEKCCIHSYYSFDLMLMLNFTEAYKCVYTNMNNSLELMLLEGLSGG